MSYALVGSRVLPAIAQRLRSPTPSHHRALHVPRPRPVRHGEKFSHVCFQLRNLFEMGYSLMSMNKDGQTALHVASQRGDSNLVRYILANAPSNIVSVKDNQE